MKTDVTLGIDIGGTNTVFGFVDKDGKCVAQSSILTNSNEESSLFFPRLFAEIESLIQNINKNYNFIGIGIGAPNANYFKGTIEYPPNLN